MLSDSIARALAIPANRTGRSLSDVEHIAVLTQENRSFDSAMGRGPFSLPSTSTCVNLL